MRTQNALFVALNLALRISISAAAPPISRPFSAAGKPSSLNLVRPLADGTNITRQVTLPVELTYQAQLRRTTLFH